MVKEVPTWLDRTFLTKALQGDQYQTKVTVLKFNIQPAVAAGNNYMGNLFRVHVHFKTDIEDHIQSKALIVKAPHSQGYAKEIAEKIGVYERENQIYNILPKMYEVHNHEFAPKSYFCTEVNALVLDDMREQGYTMLDRVKQLDFEHCKPFLNTLAKFHATSVAVSNKYPQCMERSAKEDYFVNNRPEISEFQSYMQGGLRGMITMCEELKGCKHFADMFRKRLDTLWDTMVDIFNRDGLKVLNHGDLWTNNILFKHDDLGNVIDTKLIDFQMSRYASPTIDLIYFLWTSTNEDVRENRQDELFEIYRQTLNETFERLSCSERLSKDELHNELKKSGPYTIVVISNCLPVILADADKVVDMDAVTQENVNPESDNNPFMKMYKGKHFRSIVPNLLKQVEKFGAFA